MNPFTIIHNLSVEDGRSGIVDIYFAWVGTFDSFPEKASLNEQIKFEYGESI